MASILKNYIKCLFFIYLQQPQHNLIYHVLTIAVKTYKNTKNYSNSITFKS